MDTYEHGGIRTNASGLVQNWPGGCGLKVYFIAFAVGGFSVHCGIKSCWATRKNVSTPCNATACGEQWLDANEIGRGKVSKMNGTENQVAKRNGQRHDARNRWGKKGRVKHKSDSVPIAI